VRGGDNALVADEHGGGPAATRTSTPYTISREIGATKFAVITRDRSEHGRLVVSFPYLIPGYYEGKRKIEQFVTNDVENAGKRDLPPARGSSSGREGLCRTAHVGEDRGAAGRGGIS